QYFTLGPWKIRCEHGDLINQSDKAYLRLRSVLRHPVVEEIGHKVPGPIWDKLGSFLSRQSRQFSAVYREEKEKELIEMIRHHGEKSYKEETFDYIITGHMHVRDEFKLQQKNHTAYSV